MAPEVMGLVGGPFQHAYTSTLWKKSAHIQWDFQAKCHPRTFYVDRQIIDGTRETSSGDKYGWLLESRLVIAGLVEWVIDNLEAVLQTYEAIFTHDQRLLQLHEKFKWTPAYGLYIDKPQLHEKTKLLSMITSNKTMTKNHLLRNHLAMRWKNHLDLYGRGYHEIEKKEEGLCEYMFSVAIENDCYETYFTEKILDCFAVGTIPVYLGAPDIGKHFNENGIIVLSPQTALKDLTSDLYYEKIEAVRDNFERVLRYNVLEDWIYETYFR